jgi:hypothetical protein
VNSVDGLYAPLPETPTGEPTPVPPEQSVGAVDRGPNTLNVTVPDGEAPPDSAADSDDGSIAPPAVPAPGAERLNDGLAWATTVSAMPSPHCEARAPLLPSPLYSAYHQ